MAADKTLLANRDLVEYQPPVLDAITQQLGIRTNAGILADGHQVERSANRRTDRTVLADLGAHRPIIKAHE